jgi:hypothetical protein
MASLCRLCNINSTTDVYRVCEICHEKAANGFRGYSVLIEQIAAERKESPEKAGDLRDNANSCDLHALEPGDLEFMELMKW